MKFVFLSILLLCLTACGEMVGVTYRNGSQMTYRDVSSFRCHPAGCARGTARSISFCAGVECILEGDFLEAVHTWYDKPEPCTDCWWYDGEGLLP
jgi:hypothetical protein